MHGAGLLGDQFLYLLELARKRVLQPGATMVPNAATLYCMGIQVLTPQPGGFSFSTLDKFRCALHLHTDFLRCAVLPA